METNRPHTSDVEYHEAFASLRAAKNWFWWLLFLTIVANLAAFACVRFYPALRDSYSLQEDVARAGCEAPKPAPAATLVNSSSTQPATTQPDEPTSRPFAVNRGVTPPTAGAMLSEQIYQNMGWVLTLAKAAGLILAVLLAVTLATSLNISLSGRIGGAGYLAGAFVWSILLVALFVPWSEAFSGLVVPGVLFGREELIRETAAIAWGAGTVPLADQVLYYARFAGYPVLALLLWLAVQVKYARGFGEVAVEVETK